MTPNRSTHPSPGAYGEVVAVDVGDVEVVGVVLVVALVVGVVVVGLVVGLVVRVEVNEVVVVGLVVGVVTWQSRKWPTGVLRKALAMALSVATEAEQPLLSKRAPRKHWTFASSPSGPRYSRSALLRVDAVELQEELSVSTPLEEHVRRPL